MSRAPVVATNLSQTAQQQDTSTRRRRLRRAKSAGAVRSPLARSVPSPYAAGGVQTRSPAGARSRGIEKGASSKLPSTAAPAAAAAGAAATASSSPQSDGTQGLPADKPLSAVLLDQLELAHNSSSSPSPRPPAATRRPLHVPPAHKSRPKASPLRMLFRGPDGEEYASREAYLALRLERRRAAEARRAAAGGPALVLPKRRPLDTSAPTSFQHRVPPKPAATSAPSKRPQSSPIRRRARPGTADSSGAASAHAVTFTADGIAVVPSPYTSTFSTAVQPRSPAFGFPLAHRSCVDPIDVAGGSDADAGAAATSTTPSNRRWASTTPGPGSYDLTKTASVLPRSPQHVIQTRHPPPSSKMVTPSPQHYQLAAGTDEALRLKRGPTMGARLPSMVQPVAGPGPAYDTRPRQTVHTLRRLGASRETVEHGGGQGKPQRSSHQSGGWKA